MRGRIEDHATLQHVATVRILLRLVMTRRAGGRWRSRRASVVGLLVMMVVMMMPVIPAG